jgi:hypothetical protein
VPARHEERQRRGRVLDQRPELEQEPGVAQGVGLVDHQEPRRRAIELLEEPGDEVVTHHPAPLDGLLQGDFADPRLDGGEGGDEAAGQPLAVVVSGIEPEPAHPVPGRRRQPLPQQDGLAVAGGADHEGQPLLGGRVQRPDQAGTGDGEGRVSPLAAGVRPARRHRRCRRSAALMASLRPSTPSLR